MSTPFDPETSAVERLLHDRTRQSPPPALRARVLAAVDDVLQEKVPATTYGKDPHVHDQKNAGVVAGGFLMATALSLLIVMTLSSEASSRRVDAAHERPVLSFARRAEAAGITLDVASPSTAQVAGHDIRLDDETHRRDILRSLDARSFLQGDL